MKKIVADCDIPFLGGVLEPFAKVTYIKGVEITNADLADADVLIVRTRTQCNRELLENSSVKLIITATIGFDHIDMHYCEESGIEIVTAAGCNARGVLQWISGVLCHASRTQGWTPSQRTLGVVGVGHVGSLIVEYARMWGFRVLCCDPPRQAKEQSREFVSLDIIIEQSDIITFHVPLIRSGAYPTYHLADKEFFSKIREGSLIINSSRGEVVDNRAVNSAIADRVCSCAIDTWENEPNINEKLLSQALVATTHIAGYSAQGKANGTSIAVNTIAEKFGFPLKEWYPSDYVERITPRPITWDQMCSSIGKYFDTEAETARFKTTPDEFENIRNNYLYRTEYF